MADIEEANETDSYVYFDFYSFTPKYVAVAASFHLLIYFATQNPEKVLV